MNNPSLVDPVRVRSCFTLAAFITALLEESVRQLACQLILRPNLFQTVPLIERVTTIRTAQTVLGSYDRQSVETTCPGIDTWLAIVQGRLAATADNVALVRHAAHCDHCRTVVLPGIVGRCAAYASHRALAIEPDDF